MVLESTRKKLQKWHKKVRTVKRQTETLNVAKKIALESLTLAYAREKNYWLDVLKANKMQSQLDSPRQIRDEAIKNKYQSRCCRDLG